jgi:hypothetical protein
MMSAARTGNSSAIFLRTLFFAPVLACPSELAAAFASLILSIAVAMTQS